jgi:hypothetical protein
MQRLLNIVFAGRTMTDIEAPFNAIFPVPIAML